MRKEKPPPIGAKLLESTGKISSQWIHWFQRVGRHFDNVRRQPDIVYTADATLTTDDYGKVIVMDASSSNRVCTLMTANSLDVSCWLTIFRKGQGRLTIVADSASRIEYGSLGGRIWCDEVKRAAANVTLQLMELGQWGITGATGIWYVR